MRGLSSVGWFVLINLLFATIAWVGLFVAMALGDVVAKWLERQQSFDPQLMELGVTVLGPVGAVFLLVWLTTSGYVLLIPGLLCAIAATMMFCRPAGASGQRLVILELSFALGIVVVAGAFVTGTVSLIAEIRDSLHSITAQYGPLLGILPLSVVLAVSATLYKLFEWNQRRRNSMWSARMQTPTYRKLQEEKWLLGRRLREIDDMQEYLGRDPGLPTI